MEDDISIFRKVIIYERLQDDNNIFYKMKNDLTMERWQDDI
jgi:hypothetical protein